MTSTDRTLGVIGVLLVCATLIYTFKPHSNTEGIQGISVYGEAIAQVQPDTLTLYFNIQEKADTSLEAQTKVDELSKTFISAIKELGVDANRIQTSNYSVYQNYYWKTDEYKQIPNGYNANQSITVILDGEGFVEL